MSKLPKGWEKKTLNDISELTSSKRIYLSDYVEKGVPFFRGKEISQLKKNEKVEDILYISEEKYEEIKQKFGIPVKNDILITAVGTLANTYRIPNNDKFYFKDGNLIWLKNISEYSIYVEYSLNFNKKLLLDSAIGSSQKALTIAELKKIELAFPPIEEQKKIADILSTVDKKIAFVEENINATEELKKGLMQKLLTEGIGHTEFKDSELGRIPESWEIVQIKELGSVVTGSTPKTANKEFYEKGTKLWASPSDLGKSKEIRNTATKLSKLGFEQTRILPARSILVTCIGSTIGKIGIAYQEMSTNQQINSVVCNEKNDSDFYFYILDQKKDYIKKLAGTQAVPLLNKTDFSAIKVPKVPLAEQKQIAKILSTVDTKLENLKEKKQSFEELKKGLMQKLLTGEVRV